ncbi:MAG: VPLPA-CTERM-specific exosortase XrtD [Syntrophus sp. (in: bacteria)]|nr:VPLPA-CTERM-specific exosortase XrtD [Syntrophus sp. (in: bacteria)]
MIKALGEIHIKSASWMKAAIYGIILVLAYFSALKWMVFVDWAKEDYSHCYLVPFIVLYLIWDKRKELAELPSFPSWKGMAPFGLGIALFWLGELSGEFFTMYLSFWLVVIGLCWLHLGWDKIKTIWFALFVMLAMFPFPNFVNVRISQVLKLISSQLGVWMLHIYGMSAYREGNIIDLGFTQLQVVDACSGLRYVFPLMVLSLLLAYMFKAHIWKRTTLFLSSIPLAIFVNSFRIASTGVLYSIFDARVAEGFFHGFSGWLIFLFAIPFLVFEMWILRKFPPKEGGSQKSEGRGQRAEGRGRTIDIGKPTRMFIAALVVISLTFGLSRGIEFREKTPIKKSFSLFPMNIGEWSGKQGSMEQQFIDVLKFSDYITADYTNPQGETINFYVAYYQDQRKGESIHSPETCLPGSGWEFREAGDVDIPLGRASQVMRVNRSFMEKSGAVELTYYWFPMRGRVLTKLYEVKLYNFWDALTKQRTDGALVRLITPVHPKETLKDTEARLQSFVRNMVPVLNEYLPGK